MATDGRLRELLRDIMASNRQRVREAVRSAEDFSRSCAPEIVHTLPDFYRFLAAVNEGRDQTIQGEPVFNALEKDDISTENLKLVEHMDNARIEFAKCRCEKGIA